jgi:hypothetical protein
MIRYSSLIKKEKLVDTAILNEYRKGKKVICSYL